MTSAGLKAHVSRHRWILVQVFQASESIGLRHRKRSDRRLALAAHPQGLAAGDEEPETRARRQEQRDRDQRDPEPRR